MAGHALLQENVLRDLMELSQNSAFMRLCTALRSRRDGIREAVEDSDDAVIVHRLRGASGELHELLRYFEKPDTYYASMRTRQTQNAARQL